MTFRQTAYGKKRCVGDDLCKNNVNPIKLSHPNKL